MPKRAISPSPFLRSDGAPDREPTDLPAAKRRLTTILSADVTGFSRLMEADEEGTLRTLMAYRVAIDGLISSHEGRLVGTAGDSVLAEFSSPVEAARCAADIQHELAQRNAEAPQDRRLEFRIGINLGDVLVEGSDIFGDGVNIAARLEALADPGGIFISGGVYDQIKAKRGFHCEFLGLKKVKNITEPVRVYRLHPGPAAALAGRHAQRRRRWGVIAAVVAFTVAALIAAWQVVPLFDPGIERLSGLGRILPAAEGASVAVLPFANQGDAEDEYFSDGLTEDLISALGRFSSLSVTSWNAVASYRNQSPQPDQLAQDLSVRYIVDGSVRRSGDNIRVVARLSDAERGTLLWSERYDDAASDIFAVQDRITRQIVSTLATRMSYFEQERALAKPTESLGAYDYYLRGRQSFRRFTRSANLQARDLFGKAVELDPDYADANAALAGTYIKAAEMGWTEWPAKALERAHDLAQAALRADPSNESARVRLAMVHGYRRQYEHALAELDRASQSNPNDTRHYAERGWVLVLAGRWDEAIETIETGLRYDPNPSANTYSNLGLAYYFRAREDEAVVMLEGAIARYPHHVPIHIYLTAAYARAERIEDATHSASRLRRLSPFFAADAYGDIIRDPADRERLREDLRKAGL